MQSDLSFVCDPRELAARCIGAVLTPADEGWDAARRAFNLAGAMVWDWRESARVLDRWAVWAVDAPDAVTTCARIVSLPPVAPIPAALRGRRVLDGLTRAAVTAFVAVAGPGSKSPLMSAELRQLGGALRRPHAEFGASYARLETIRAQVDPDGLFLAHHSIDVTP